MICRRGRRSTTTCAAGRRKVCGGTSTMRWCLPTVNAAVGKPRPRRRSSTASRSAPPIKKRRQGLRRGQEGHRAQAPHPDRHRRTAPHRLRPRRRRPGPRRRQAAARGLPPTLPLRRPRLRRWRLCRTPRNLGCRQDAHLARDHPPRRPRQRLRGAAAALGGRAHLRLDLQEPAPGPRLRAAHRRRRDPHNHRRLRHLATPMAMINRPSQTRSESPMRPRRQPLMSASSRPVARSCPAYRSGHDPVRTGRLPIAEVTQIRRCSRSH